MEEVFLTKKRKDRVAGYEPNEKEAKSRTESEAPRRDDEEGSSTINMEDIADVLQRMIGFLKHSERLNLSMTCKSMCRRVETYSSMALTRILENHDVDDTFEERIRDRTKIPQAIGNQQSLPFRYLLHTATRTHLYRLEIMRGKASRNAFVFKTGNRLLTNASHGLYEWIGSVVTSFRVHFWDLDNKRCLRIDEIPALFGEKRLQGVFGTQQYIVVCTDKRIVTSLTEDGRVIHAYRHETGIESVLQQNEFTVLFMDTEQKLYSYDIPAGIVRFVVQYILEPNEVLFGTFHNENFLVVATRPLQRARQLRVLDLNHGFRDLSHFLTVADFPCEMRQSPDNSNTIYISQVVGDLRLFQVLLLDELGHFTVVSNHQIQSSPDESLVYVGYYQRYVVAEKMGETIAPYQRRSTRVAQIHSPRDWDLERTILCPINHNLARVKNCFTSSTSKELFFWLLHDDPRHGRNDANWSLAAYLNEEY